MDRFSDLILIIGKYKVTVDLFSMGRDGTIDVQITGESEITRKLDACLHRVAHILSSAPVTEEV